MNLLLKKEQGVSRPHRINTIVRLSYGADVLIIMDQKIASSFTAVDACVNEIILIMTDIDALSDEGLLFRTSFVLREILNNAVEHGNGFDETKKIDCHIAYDSPYLKIKIKDEGEGFQVNESYYDALDNDKRERHRGLKLIEELKFEIHIHKSTFKLKTNVIEKG